MDFKGHFQLMAQYNQRMNHQVYQAAAQLTAEQFNQDQGAFFGSISGVLNHILVGDLIWLSRFAQHQVSYQSLKDLSLLPKPKGLDHLLFSELDALSQARQHVDSAIICWLDKEAASDHFYQDLSYSNTKGIVSQRNFAELVSHLFNHQTHHRGQVSTLLFQSGTDIGVTDFLMDIPDKASTQN